MKDDVETLREFIAEHSQWVNPNKKEALAALERIETARAADGYKEFREMRQRAEAVEAERDSLRKNLDDRFAADKRAAKAIFAATGRKWGFPDNKEVVAYYMAEVERLEKETTELNEAFERLIRTCERAQSERDPLRAKLERAKAWLRREACDCETECFSGASTLDRCFKGRARAVLSELSADAPAQQEPDRHLTLDEQKVFHSALRKSSHATPAQQTQISDDAAREAGNG